MTLPRESELAKRVSGLSRFRKILLTWYDRERRDLPWRRPPDGDPAERAWEIWLSEVMAQQTRLEVAVPYWERFLRRYPDPGSLAAAPEEEVLALWSGLGYYRRARQLVAASREVAERGEIPRTAAELRELPGIGPYTAAAIASIAFGEVVAVVDGNVERVIARVLEIEEDPKRAAGRRRILRGAEALLDADRPGDSNQAMMELGARICRPRSPRCGRCVLAEACGARRKDRIAELPRARRRRRTVRISRRVAVAQREDGQVLLVRRSDDRDVMPGFWELPGVGREGDPPELPEAERALGRRFGGRWSLGPREARVRHAITHRSMVLHVHRAVLRDGATVGEGVEAIWWDPAAGAERPLGSATRKVLDALGRAQSPSGDSSD